MTGPAVAASPVTDLGVGPARPTDGPGAARLRRRLDVALGDSRRSVDDLLPGVDVRRLADGRGGSVASGRAGAALSVALPAAGLIDQVLDGGPLGPPRKVWRGGSDVAAGAPVETGGPAALAAAIAAGATVIVDAVDRWSPAAMRVAEHLERVAGRGVDLNLYLSRGDHGSFAPHWDDHEVLVLHLVGTKRWEVHAPPAPHPHRAVHPDGVSGEVAWAGTLTAGSWLSVPRGWGHRVTGGSDTSVHVTVSFASLTGLDAIDDLVAAMRSGTAVDDGIDLFALAAAPPGLVSLRDRLPESLARVRLGALVEAPFRPTGRTDRAVSALVDRSRAGALVRSCAPGEVLIGRSPGHPDRLVAGRRAFDVAPAAWDAVVDLLDARARDLAAVDAAAAAGGHPDLADDLLACGLLEVLDDPPGWGVATAEPVRSPR